MIANQSSIKISYLIYTQIGTQLSIISIDTYNNIIFIMCIIYQKFKTNYLIVKLFLHLE